MENIFFPFIRRRRQILANRLEHTDWLNNDEFSNIMIGPRADGILGDIFRLKNQMTFELFNDNDYLLEIFEKTRPSHFPLQIAFDRAAFNMLIGEFTDDNWL